MSDSSAETVAGATHWVTVRENRFAYSDAGEGPVVLSAHGLSSSRANDRLMSLADFSPIARAGHRLISYDARGHGESQASSSPDDYSWAELALDMLALADHFSPSAPVSAVGSSMGTGTLLHAATSHPERFSRLVLTAPPTAWQTRAGQGDIYRGMADFVENSTPEALAAMSSQAPLPPIFAEVPGFPPAPDVAFDLIPTVFRGAAGADLPPIKAIAALTQPTLILAWAGDPGHPVSTAEKLAAAIAGSELHVAETLADMHTWGERAAEFLR